MTETTVTPEMMLFLAGKMGLLEPCICGGVVDYVENECKGLKNYADFAPHTDPAQFGRLVVWAALQGLEPMLAKRHAFAGLVGTSSDYTQAHDSTEAGIMAATVVAIARALGWEGEA